MPIFRELLRRTRFPGRDNGQVRCGSWLPSGGGNGVRVPLRQDALRSLRRTKAATEQLSKATTPTEAGIFIFKEERSIFDHLQE